MSKGKKVLIFLLLALVLLALAAFALLALPYLGAKSSMPDGESLSLRALDGDTYLLEWQEAENADAYLVEVVLAAQTARESDVVLASGSCTEPRCTLANLPEGRIIRVRVNSRKDYSQLWRTKTRTGDNPVEVTFRMRTPMVSSLEKDTDPEAKLVYLNWDGTDGDSYRVYCEDGSGERQLVRETKNSEALVRFGDGGDLPMPDFVGQYVFTVESRYEKEALVICGPESEGVSVTRNDLLGTVISLECEDLGNNFYELRWNEVRGEGYELRVLDDDTGLCRDVRYYSKTDELTYTTDRLSPFTEYSVSVTAVGAPTLPDGTDPSVPGRGHISTGASAVFATVWPLMDLDIYEAPDKQTVLGTASAARAYCVTEETDGLFRVRTGEGYGYIDSNFCLINLPDYLGDICAYDITNSYSSLYKVHEYGIPEVTDTVVEGYEDVQTFCGDYLVPLLYPVAKKLVPAALAAIGDGYRLKIYDSYRPNVATRSIYSLTLAIVDEPLPEETFSGEPVEDLPETAEGETLTYRALVENDKYDLGNFLATRGSYHNMGIALDLTLETLADGEELEMQTAMHDLSWYSVVAEDNDSALLLARYMTGAGFGGLTSEWWHFQDNDTRDALSLKTYMWNGVSSEGWKTRDGVSWQYLRPDGSCYINTTLTIDGVQYSFNRYGYLE